MRASLLRGRPRSGSYQLVEWPPQEANARPLGTLGWYEFDARRLKSRLNFPKCIRGSTNLAACLHPLDRRDADRCEFRKLSLTEGE